MKRILLATLLITGSYGAAQTQQCLENATHRELINELERRLVSTPTGEVVLNYFCTISDLRFEAFLANGEVVEKNFGYLSQPQCEEQKADLRKHHSRAKDATMLAFCDNIGTLSRIMVSPAGVTEYSSIDYYNYTRCIQEAKFINIPPSEN